MSQLSEKAANLQFLYDASRLFAAHRDPADAVEQIADILVELYGAQWASIHIDLAGNQSLKAEAGKRRSNAGLNWERSIDAQGLPVQLKVQFPAVTPATASMDPALHLTLRQLADIAATKRLEARRDAAHDQLRQTRNFLAEEKLLTRAIGILSARQALTESDARLLLDREARRLGLPPTTLATRIIERDTASPGLALRKIA